MRSKRAIEVSLTMTAVCAASSCSTQQKFSVKSTQTTCISNKLTPANSEQPLGIVGGVFAGNSTDPEKATAGILALHTFPNGRITAGHCTGVVATKNAIITAAHCVTPPRNARTTAFVTFSSTLSTNVNAYSNRSLKIDIHPSYDPEGINSNFDIAVVTLTSDIPGGQVIPSFVSTTEPLSPGRGVTAIGYGVTGTQQDDSGVKRKAQLQIVNIIDEVSYPNSPLFYQVRVADSGTDSSSACFGDSGGPGFLEDSATVFGLVQGTHGSVNSNPTSCESSDYNYTLIAPYMSWIEETLGESLNRDAEVIRIKTQPLQQQVSQSSQSPAISGENSSCPTQ